MLFQIVESEIIRDIAYVVRFCSIPIFMYFTFRSSKKIKDPKFSLASLGFTIIMLTFLMYLITMFVSSFYLEVDQRTNPVLVVDLIMAFGMFIFVLFTEIELKSHASEENSKKFAYPLTIIASICILVFLPLCFIALINVITMLALLFFPFNVSVYNFMNRFKNLELVKREKPIPIFIFGVLLVYLSNLLLNPLFFEYFDIMTLQVIAGTGTILGGFMMCRAWNRLPSLGELNWMNKLERLLLIHVGDYVLLFQYCFQTELKDCAKFEQMHDIAGGAFGGMDMLLKEILDSKSHIKEIDYSDKKVFFNQGISTICVLIASDVSVEFKYRLDMFHLSFEKKYIEELKYWNKVDAFRRTDVLVRKYFS